MRPARARAAGSRLVQLACAGLLGLTACLPVQAALFGDDEARKAIIELRAKVDANRQSGDSALTELRHQQDEQVANSRRAVLELANQVETLRAELAQLRGQNEQLARDVTELQRQQKSLLNLLDERLRSLEPVRVSQDGADFTVQPREKAEFEAAMVALRAADFDKAADLYGQFMRRYPESGYLPAALYWQGNARYASRDYKPAIDSYRALIAKVPNHARVPEAMLAIANCQQELKDAKAAKRTLEELFKSYPKSEAGIAARDRLARMQ
ncbi:MAG: tol-pal system protein YbgF [Pseudomonadota bacterium]